MIEEGNPWWAAWKQSLIWRSVFFYILEGIISKIYTFAVSVSKNGFSTQIHYVFLHTINRISIGAPDEALNECMPGKLSPANGPIAQIACWFWERSSMYNSLPFVVITFLLKLQNNLLL